MEQKLSRRQGRERAFLLAFSATFDTADLPGLIAQSRELEENAVDAFGEQLLLGLAAHQQQIDGQIEAHLRGWALNRLPRVSLCALRLALSEMLYGEEKLPSVAINEAVELTKKYGGSEDHQFVNGVLGAIARELGLADAAAPASAPAEETQAPEAPASPAPEAAKAAVAPEASAQPAPQAEEPAEAVEAPAPEAAPPEEGAPLC